MEWKWLRFDQLSVNQLYAMLQVRQEVFVVEQNCIYLDADGVDQHSWHLMAMKEEAVLAYCRVVDPGIKYDELSIGRVLTAQSARGTGLGKILLQNAIDNIEHNIGAVPIRISAQQYLEKYYLGFGFKTVSEPYDEDGIPHIEMLRSCD